MGFSNQRWPPCKYSIHLLLIQDGPTSTTITTASTATTTFTTSVHPPPPHLPPQQNKKADFKQKQEVDFFDLLQATYGFSVFATHRDRQPQPCEKTAHPDSPISLGRGGGGSDQSHKERDSQLVSAVSLFSAGPAAKEERLPRYPSPYGKY